VNLFYLLLRNAWGTVLLAGLAGLINGGSTAGLVAFINSALNRNDISGSWLSWGFVGFSFALMITNFSSQVLLVRAAQGAIFQLRLLLSRLILASPLRTLEQIGNPQLLATLTDDVEAVSRSFSVLPGLCNAIAIVAGCLFYMAWLSWTAFLILVGLIIFGVFSYEFLAGRASKFLRLAREDQDRLFQHFRALTDGNKELKLNRNRRKAFVNQQLKVAAASSRQHNLRGMTAFAVAATWGQLLLFVTIGFFLFILPHLISAQTNFLPKTVLSGYVLTIIYLMMPMQQIIEAVPVLTRASVALNKIDSLNLSLSQADGGVEHSRKKPAKGKSAQAPTAKAEPELSEAAAQPWQRLQLVGINHTYSSFQGDNKFDFTLGPIDLAFDGGELVFIVGGNGSGKSTLIKILTGLYTPEIGTIFVDGQPITEDRLEWYRQHFSVIFADFYLFDSFLGIQNRDLDARARDYIEKLRLSHKVQVNDGTLSTLSLSQGERKRLALLTAYLEDHPVCVFDEWASDQDPIFRDFFYTQMLGELKQRGKSVFVISHDDRYFHVADRIIKLDYGKVEYDKVVSSAHPHESEMEAMPVDPAALGSG
jgi:putative pyoverdin transport system ATP-binding/permease protein